MPPPVPFDICEQRLHENGVSEPISCLRGAGGQGRRWGRRPFHRRVRTPAERTRAPVPGLLTVCRLSEPRKNVDLVLRALARLKSDFGFRYTVVGEGDQEWALTQLAAELGLADRVRFTGRVADAELRSHYQQADLFVLPSGVSSTSFEGFGIVYLEANAMGVPTMALRAAGAAEAVDEGRSGFFVEKEDVASIESRATFVPVGRKGLQGRRLPEVCGRVFMGRYRRNRSSARTTLL